MPSILRMHFGMLLTLCVAGLLGCNSKPTTVAGNVTLDGKPLAKGSITFEPATGDSATAGGTVVDGKYSLELTPGSKRVMITGYEIVGQKPAYGNNKNGPMRDITKSIVPPKYNQQTTLTAEIKPGVNEGVNFELTTK